MKEGRIAVGPLCVGMVHHLEVIGFKRLSML